MSVLDLCLAREAEAAVGHPSKSWRSGRPLAAVCILLVVSLLLTAPATAEPPGTGPTGAAVVAAPIDPTEPSKIDSDLASSLDDKGSADFYVDFADQADLSAAAEISDWAERGAAVVEALQKAADASQAELRSQLDAAEVDYTSFWISNTVLVRGGSQALADSAAALDQVQALRSPETFDIPDVSTGVEQPAVDAVEWGVDRIQADDVWSTFGVRGEGIVVASIDSGVKVEHPALARQYRGLAGRVVTQDYNWFDPSGICGTPAPCDNNNHGTHTMGTMVGDDGAGNQIGVAPGARWIAAKGCETSSCSDTALLASGQWMLAPTRIDGTDPDPAKRPNIINNSWGAAAGRTWFSDTIDAWRAAGIFPAFSNGNSGPACGTAGSPGNDEDAFASGAFDVNNAIASFSSRGSSGGPTKPNLAAPGVNVRSSIADGGYAALNGTSMASPHTAGTVALMWSAAPSLVGDITGTMDLLNRTAVDTADLTCGGTEANNNVWGEGRLDALAAVTASPTVPTGTITGTVTTATGAPIDGATIAFSGTVQRTADTTADGSYSLSLPAGDYTLTATVFGHEDRGAALSVAEGGTSVQDFALAAMPTATVSGTVNSTTGPVPDAAVAIDGTPIPPARTGPDGSFSFAAVPHGTYRLTATGSNCDTPAASDIVVDGDRIVDFALLQRSDSHGYTCTVEATDFQSAGTPLALVGDDGTAPIDLPFPFLFYGNTYSKAWVSTNGHLNFLASVVGFSNTGIPSTGTPNAAIYPFWDDLNVVDGTGQVLTGTSGVAPNRSFVIEWRGVSFYRDATRQIDFQAQLNEDGSIVTRYRGLDPDPRERGSSATVGIENASGTVALQYSSNTPVLSDTASVRFVPPVTGIVTGMITDANDQSPIAGATVRALQGGVAVSTTAADTDGRYALRLKLGEYTVEAAATNYAAASTRVTVSTDGETITGDFSLATSVAALSAPSLSFLGVADQLRTARLTLANQSTSGVKLTFSVADGQSWLWTVPSTGSVPAGGSATLTVRVDATGVPAGVTIGAITITTNAGRQPVLQVPVTLTVPAYRNGINVGGNTQLDTTGDQWAADQAWTPGGTGYLGTGWITTTRQPIAGTDDDALHQTAREAASGYRFDNLPAGTYLVELDFVEFRRTLAPDRRVFDVSINGEQVLTGYDPVAAVGTLTLDHREFTATVADNGYLAIDLGARRGKLPPALTGIRVTHQPSP